MPAPGPFQRSNISMCKYTAIRALFIWLLVIRTQKCDTSNIKTSYCIRCEVTGCVLSRGLQLQLHSSLTSVPYAGGWWTAHLGLCTARERALGTYGVGGCLDHKTVLDTLENRNLLFLQGIKPNFLCWPVCRLVIIPNAPNSGVIIFSPTIVIFPLRSTCLLSFHPLLRFPSGGFHH
jgi:hypothetical protein